MKNTNYANRDTVLFKAVSRRVFSYSTDSALLSHVEAYPGLYLLSCLLQALVTGKVGQGLGVDYLPYLRVVAHNGAAVHGDL